MSSLPPEYDEFSQHVKAISRNELEHFTTSLWARFNIEEEEKGKYIFNPDKEVSGGDLVELTAQLLEILNKSPIK